METGNEQFISDYSIVRRLANVEMFSEMRQNISHIYHVPFVQEYFLLGNAGKAGSQRKWVNCHHVPSIFPERYYAEIVSYTG